MGDASQGKWGRKRYRWPRRSITPTRRDAGDAPALGGTELGASRRRATHPRRAEDPDVVHQVRVAGFNSRPVTTGACGRGSRVCRTSQEMAALEVCQGMSSCEDARGTPRSPTISPGLDPGPVGIEDPADQQEERARGQQGPEEYPQGCEHLRSLPASWTPAGRWPARPHRPRDPSGVACHGSSWAGTLKPPVTRHEIIFIARARRPGSRICAWPCVGIRRKAVRPSSSSEQVDRVYKILIFICTCM